MLKEEFETWPADFICNATLLTFNIHVTNLGYLENVPLCFTELPNSNTEDLNRTLGGLDNAAAILDNNNKHSLDLLDLKAK